MVMAFLAAAAFVVAVHKCGVGPEDVLAGGGNVHCVIADDVAQVSHSQL